MAVKGVKHPKKKEEPFPRYMPKGGLLVLEHSRMGQYVTYLYLE
jgi:hypothetical protein